MVRSEESGVRRKHFQHQDPEAERLFWFRISQDYSPNAFDVEIQSNRSNPEAEKRF